jgi:transcriptional regulator with XRE-family HTH domain
MARPDGVLFDPAAFETARVKALLSVGEVAARAGCSRRLLSCVRNGRPVSLAKARAIARVLRVPLKSLLQREPEALRPGARDAHAEPRPASREPLVEYVFGGDVGEACHG